MRRSLPEVLGCAEECPPWQRQVPPPPSHRAMRISVFQSLGVCGSTHQASFRSHRAPSLYFQDAQDALLPPQYFLLWRQAHRSRLFCSKILYIHCVLNCYIFTFMLKYFRKDFYAV